MAADGQVVFEVRIDSNSIGRDLESITQQIETESKKWDNATNGAFTSIKNQAETGSGDIQKAFSKAFDIERVKQFALDAVNAIKTMVSDSVKYASELREVQNVADATFGEEGGKKLEKWARNALMQYGLVETAAKRYASTFGSAMTGTGLGEEEIYDLSTRLTQAASDITSFYDSDFDTAFGKLYSGIIGGMTKPLDTYGINLRVNAMKDYAEQMGKVWDDLNEGEKIALRAQKTFEQLDVKGVTGDFFKTRDTYANAERRIESDLVTLQTELGKAIYPIASMLENAVADFLDILVYKPEDTVFDKASESIAEAQSNATQATSILDYLDKLYQKYGEAATKTGEWASAMERLKQVFPEINGYIDEQTGKLTASNDKLKEYVENSRLASIEESKKAAIQELQNQYYEASVKYGAAAGERDFAESQMQSITDALINYIVENYKASADAKQMPEDVRQQFLDAGYWRNMLTSGQFDMRDIFMSARNAAKFNDQNTDVVDQFQSDYEAYAESLSSASAEVETLKGEMESLQGQLATAESVLASLASAASSAAATLDAVASSGGGGGGIGGGAFNLNIGGKGNPNVTLTPFAVGLDSVPFDGFLASLHEGESILTAEEARVWRNMKYGPSFAGNQFDYGAMGSAIGANMPNFNGMEVRWNGQVLGRVIAAQQADSLRTMERSGWRG